MYLFIQKHIYLVCTIAVLLIVIFTGNYVTAQSQNFPTLEEIQESLSIQWTGAPPAGINTPAKLQTGMKTVTIQINPIFSFTYESGEPGQVIVEENYIAVSPTINYSDALLGQGLSLTFKLEEANGDPFYIIGEIPISSEYEFGGSQSNSIQFFSVIEPDIAYLSTMQSDGAEANPRTGPFAGFPSGEIVVRAYLNGGGIDDVLFDEHTIGEYVPGFILMPTTTTEIETGGIQTAGGGMEMIETETITITDSQFFNAAWKVEHYQDPMSGGYLFDILVNPIIKNMDSGNFRLDISKERFPVLNPSNDRVLLEGPEIFPEGNEIVNQGLELSVSGYDDEAQENPLLADSVGRPVFIGLYYDDEILSFRRVHNYNFPSQNYISVDINGISGQNPIRLIESNNQDTFALDFNVAVNFIAGEPSGTIDIRVGTSFFWQPDLYSTGSETVTSSQHVFSRNINSLEDFGGPTLALDTPYYVLVYHNGNPIAGQYLGMVGQYEMEVPVGSPLTLQGNQENNQQSNQTGNQGPQVNTNIANPSVGGMSFSTTGSLESMSISEVGLIPCGRRFGPEATRVSCNFDHVVIIIQNLITLAFALIMPIAAIMFMYAGFLLITSGGNSEKRKKAKNIFGKAIMGVIFILSAWLIVSLVFETLDVDRAFRLLDF